MWEKEPFQPGSRVREPYIHLDQYQTFYRRSITDPEEFWGNIAREYVSWIKPWDKVLDWDYGKAYIRWFLGATLNVCYNCVDRHLATRAQKTALICEGNEPGEVRRCTYQELYHEVCRVANALKSLGIKKGDRVAIYMPMVPEAVFSILACARIGAVHSVIFAGFSADSIRGRVEDSQAKLIITANEGIRGAKHFKLKDIVDEAIEPLSFVEHVLVYQRTQKQTSMKDNRDIWWHHLVPSMKNDCPCEEMDSEDPLFILYTSGSTGKPKGALHTQGGYLVYVAATHKLVFDYKEDDIYFCAADIGWITGHSYIVYGPLANGATTVMFESVPNYPDAGRYWDVIDRHKVSIFYTAPTAIRSVAKEGESLPDKYNLSTLRILGSVGEPINEDAWLWYYNRVGRKECSVVDTWWQTETGGILISPLPGAIPTKPGSATFPFFGIQPVIVDDNGNELTGNSVRGKLCIKFPWPGQMRTVYGDQKRFFETYFSQFPGLYFTGDACIRDGDGYYWITGRVDDVLNVSGHRIGTAELESALVQSGVVAEAAVVGVPHEIKGIGIFSFCILREGVVESHDIIQKIKDAAKKGIGGFAVPDHILCVPGLPRTRSGKIMRRILRKIAEGQYGEIGDTTTLADPTIVSAIIEKVKRGQLHL